MSGVLFLRRAAAQSALLLLFPMWGLAQGPYSAGLNDPENAFDAPVPGFIGPHGEGKARILQSGGTFRNPDNYVNPIFAGWATRHINYLPAPEVAANWQHPDRALGEVTGDNFDIVSLGDLNATQITENASPGEITLTFFTQPIRNKSGADFVIYENAFGNAISVFAELAYVEVSSDGQEFVRFPSVSNTASPVWSFGNIDPRNVFGLAGKHINAYGESWGTPFDLSWLEDQELVIDGKVDLDAITHIRIVDIPGSGDFLDSDDNPIYDAWLTFGSGGFDLEAVGVISHDLTFSRWLENEAVDASMSGPQDDASGNGVPNLIDYAQGRSIREPDLRPVSRGVIRDSNLGLTFVRDERVLDLVYEVQVSEDLTQEEWITIARSVNGELFAGVDGFEPLIEETPAHHIASIGVLRAVTVVDPNPDGAPVRFLRWVVSLPESP